MEVSLSFHGKSPNGRGEGGEERQGRPLGSPVVPHKDGEPDNVILSRSEESRTRQIEVVAMRKLLTMSF